MLDEDPYSYGYSPEDSQLNGHLISADSEGEALCSYIIRSVIAAADWSIAYYELTLARTRSVN